MHTRTSLRFFLFGADLPDAVIAKFAEKVGIPLWVTSGDIVPIGKFARALAREYRLDQVRASEEFFKLCLDIGLDRSTAINVMRSVKKLP